MELFKKKEHKEETEKERINRIIKEKAGKHYMEIYEEDIDTEDLDLLYEHGWELVAYGGYLTQYYYFRKRDI